MTATYVLPITDRYGGTIEVATGDATGAYARVAPTDRAGASYQVSNSPDVVPLTGQFPVVDRASATWLVSYALRGVTSGGFEDSMGEVTQAVESALLGQGVATQYDDGPLLSRSPSLDSVARVRLTTTGSEVLGWGASITLRFRGVLAVELWSAVEVGSARVLALAELLKATATAASTARYEGHSYRRLGLQDVKVSNADHTKPLWGVQFEMQFSFKSVIDPPSRTGTVAGDFDSNVAAIQTAFATVAAASGVAVQHDNTTWPDPAPSALWCQLQVEQGDASGGLTFGGNSAEWRRGGNMRVLINAPDELGTGPTWRFADKIVQAFACTSHGGAVFDVPSASVVGRDGRWWVTGVDCRFTVDEVR